MEPSPPPNSPRNIKINMPPPTRPASHMDSESSCWPRKRKREASGYTPSQRSPSCYSSSQLSSQSLGKFSLSTKRQILAKAKSHSCWNCGASPVEICHVLGRADSNFDFLKSMHLINLSSREDVNNGIALCPTCHVNYDDYSSPGLVILPSHLEYFIQYEEANFEHRRRHLQTFGIALPRSVPEAHEYRAYCLNLKERTIEEDEEGGWYSRYMQRNFYSRGVVGEKNENPFPELKLWHGDPSAAIRRGMRIIGISITGLPSGVLKSLRKLQDLYERDPLAQSDALAIGSLSAPEDGQGGNQDSYSRLTTASGDARKDSRTGKLIADATVGRADSPLQHGLHKASRSEKNATPESFSPLTGAPREESPVAQLQLTRNDTASGKSSTVEPISDPRKRDEWRVKERGGEGHWYLQDERLMAPVMHYMKRSLRGFSRRTHSMGSNQRQYWRFGPNVSSQDKIRESLERQECNSRVIRKLLERRGQKSP